MDLMPRFQRFVWVLPLIGMAASTATAKETVEEQFYRAYFLQHEKDDCAGAAALYQEVLRDERTDKSLKDKAATYLSECREELAGRDLARLMPPDAIGYFELNRPGEKVLKLLNQLGLLADEDAVIAVGERRISVSPALIKEAFGLGGIAATVTGFDVNTQTPSGVVVINPGRLEAVRGLIETALPAGGQPIEPIGGYPTYHVEQQAFVTLTTRLVIISNERSLIEGVVERLKGKKGESLADNALLGRAGKEEDSPLLTLFVNAKPIMPMLMGMLQKEAAGDPGAAMAMTMLDPASLNSFRGRLSVTDDGLSLDVALTLDEGHRNLVFNLFRTPAIDSETLKRVPEGAAAVVAAALNESPSRDRSGRESTEQVVTALDFGRELFSNITSFAAFAMPPSGKETAGPPIPDVGLIMTVNDPAKSEALWTQMLGIAHMVGGGQGMTVEPVNVAGAEVRRYKIPNGPTMHFAAVGHDVLIATSESAVADSVKAKKKGRSIADDSGFSSAYQRIGDQTSGAILIHAGRAAQIAQGFMSAQDRAEAAPFLGVLGDTTAALIVNHSKQTLQVVCNVQGLPNVGEIVSQQLTEQMQRQAGRAELTQAMKSGQWQKALKQVNAQLAADPGNVRLLQARFKIEAVGLKNREAALATADQLQKHIGEDAGALNRLAWALLSEKEYEQGYDELALRLSRISNELTDMENWANVDTLALALFRTGKVDKAVELQAKAIELCGNCGGSTELSERLARFEAAKH